MTRPAHGFPGSHNPIGGEKRREPSLVTEPVTIICNENAISTYAILDLYCFSPSGYRMLKTMMIFFHLTLEHYL